MRWEVSHQPPESERKKVQKCRFQDGVKVGVQPHEMQAQADNYAALAALLLERGPTTCKHVLACTVFSTELDHDTAVKRV